MQSGKEEIKLFLVTDIMIALRENPEKIPKKPPITNK